MAPSRKRKAAAAAAARRQWKVGDLVLAKLKGFPAWPATVSEPEKWGFRPDWKKVLVLFFGTQQIAFCNPADVEAFTEEKKQSLLKRQGRGADFVRAVKEIIDSYEKSKKQDEGVGSDSGDVVAILGGGNSAESAAHGESKEAVETSEATVTGKSIITTYTARRRSGGLRSRKQVNHQMEPVIDKFSISSCSESLRRVQATFNDGSKYTGDVFSDVMQNKCIRRNRQVRKSPDASEWDDVDSSAFVSSGSTEDNGSEIVPGDSDSCCIIDSDCKLDQSEAGVESLDGDAELSKGLDFHVKAVVIKKKRKPSRKRMATEASELPTSLESESELEVGLHNDTKDLQIACEKFDKEYNKDDGDEHLPLVKRARVRIGKLQPPEEQNSSSQADEETCKEVSANLQDQHNNSCEAEEGTSNETAINGLEQTDPSANVKHDCLADGGSFYMKETPRCTVDAEVPNRHQISRTKESQTIGSSADGEAALPPSKRLHRALEAMSANVAEEGQPCTGPITAQTLINSPVSSSMNPVSLSPESDKRDGSGEKSLHRNRAGAFGYSSSMILEESIETPLEPDICNQAMESSPRKETCQEPIEYDDGKDLNEPCLETQAVCTVIQADSQVNFAHNLNGRRSNLLLNSVSSELRQKGEDKSDSTRRKNFGDKNLCRLLDTCKLSGESTNFISHFDEVGKAVSRNGNDLLQYSQADTAFMTIESLRSQINNSQADGECEMPKENQNDGRQKEAGFVSMSEDQLVGEDVSGFQPSSFPSDVVESPTRTSPTTTSQCHISTSESANDVHNSGSSPSTQLHYKKSVCSSVDEEKGESGGSQLPKCAGKWGNCAEAHAALTSFEGVLGSLSRTKESIGRATRIAIDCAKFGVSSKVVEILARNLETECSLHRRVDLFFLVDSITQCSRGLKGDVGGVYPSAIQAALPRLLSAAAPGSFAQENRRQCMKVLRLWLERRILPESVVRHHIQELDTLGGSSSAGVYSRRSARTERSLDDPVRDMEGMLVDEYGSNSSLQLVGLSLPQMLKDEDEGSDSDGGGFEAVTPEHYSGTAEEQETASPMRKHTRVLEDVDGELEMEDVAPSCEVENNSTSGSGGIDDALSLYSQSGQSFPLPFASLVPQGIPSSSPPLPSSPPPPQPPLPPAAPTASLMPDPYANDHNLKPHLSSLNSQVDVRPSTFQQSDPPRTHSSMSNGVQYPASECRDCLQMQFCESTSSSSNGYHVCQDYNDGPRFHHKAYHPIPPHPPPANQFSYMQPGQCGKSRRLTPPPPFSRRSWHNADGGHFNNNHERMRPAPHEFDESWRHSMPHFHGPHHPDRAKSFHPPIPYGGPSREPVRLPHRGWPYSPRGMHHRNFTPFRPSSEAPSMWRPG